MKLSKLIILIFSLALTIPLFGQNIELYQQFNGRYDYTAIGNTLNLRENDAQTPCEILTSSSANLSLNPNQNVVAAYLYWAGSGSGDFDIEINGIVITAERTFSSSSSTSTRVYFSAFADITTIIQNQGNVTYTISELDLTQVIASYCGTTSSGTNFGGWAITVIYEDVNLPLNQLNVYDGLQRVPSILTVTLDNLNVLDTVGAKIGFIAWEGDASLAVNEQLTVNGNLIGNPPLNPTNNAFNGTNSFTGATDLYNMDIDFYDIQNNITIGDTSAIIQLTSGSDVVLINNIITVLNSQLPDATITLDNFIVECSNRIVDIDYSVFNINSTDPLPANTPIAFYVNGILIAQSTTQNSIPINAFETGNIAIQIPDTIGNIFQLLLVVDDDGIGNGIINELNESNNDTQTTIEIFEALPIETLPETLTCNEGFNSASFNLIQILENNNISTSTGVLFFESLSDLESNSNAIIIPEDYSNTNNPITLFARIENSPCYLSYSFDVLVDNCPPHIPQGFSPNGDSSNDWFNIQGLYDIFENHELKIFNRYGTLIFEGNNDTPWLGLINRGLNNHGKLVPVGTYFYVIDYNDTTYPTEVGWVYVSY